MWIFFTLFYVAALLIVIVFLAGAARLNQTWDGAPGHRSYRNRSYHNERHGRAA